MGMRKPPSMQGLLAGQRAITVEIAFLGFHSQGQRQIFIHRGRKRRRMKKERAIEGAIQPRGQKQIGQRQTKPGQSKGPVAGID